jgi:BirA family biotin operon repressor/biotin-[acetyl-CoA-carboxylase] ligase
MPDDSPSLTRSSALTPRLIWRVESASTNADLVALASDPALPDFTVLATDVQTAGKGRLDRAWETRPGQALAVSVLLRPSLDVERLGWIPLLAGLAVARAAGRLIDPERVGVKWPNDVLVGGRKLSGVLSELTGDGSVVVGVGINTLADEDALPVPTATSLAVEGSGPVSIDEVLSSFLGELVPLYRSFVDAGGDATTSGIRSAVSERCVTIGARVRVELPGDAVVLGTARGIDAAGRLIVQPHDGSGLLPVSAGDVTHVRGVDG